MLRLCGLLVGIESWGGPPLALPPLGHHCPTSITPLCLPTSCCLAVLCFCLSAPSPHLPIPLSRRSADADLRRVLIRPEKLHDAVAAAWRGQRRRRHLDLELILAQPAAWGPAAPPSQQGRRRVSWHGRTDQHAQRVACAPAARRAHVASEITRTGDIGGVAFGGVKRAGGDAAVRANHTAAAGLRLEGVPRVRSNFRFRNRGTEYVSEYGVKWKRGGAKRQCDRALTPPSAWSCPCGASSSPQTADVLMPSRSQEPSKLAQGGTANLYCHSRLQVMRTYAARACSVVDAVCRP